MGQQSADLLQTAIRSAAGNSAGFLAAATGIVTPMTVDRLAQELREVLDRR
jgi:hypothetical protein